MAERHLEISFLSPLISEYRLQSLDALQLELTSATLKINTESANSSANRTSSLKWSIYCGEHNKSKHFDVLKTSPKELNADRRDMGH